MFSELRRSTSFILHLTYLEGNFPPVADRQEKAQMIGEFLRECAVLVFIFFPLESYFRGTLAWSTMYWDFVISAPLLYWGMILEGRDE
jgi:hypothetical protein